MISYISKNIPVLKYFMVWLAYTALYALAIYYVIPVSFHIILLDSAIHTILLSALGLFQWSFIRYSRYPEGVASTTSYTLLVVVSMAIWIGAGYLAEIVIVGDEYSRALSYSIPIKVIMGVLISVIIILYSISDREKKIKINEEQVADRLFFNMSEERGGETGKQAEPERSKKANEMRTEIDPGEEISTEGAQIEKIERISVKTGGRINIIPVSEIIYIQSYGDYVYMITDSGKFIKERTMKYFELSLPDSSFIRIHRSYIVNITKISRIELSEIQTQQIIMTNGEKLKISATGYKALRKFLNI